MREITAAALMARVPGTLPELLGFEIVDLEDRRLRAAMSVEARHLAPNGYLHAATIIALADTACGMATLAHLPDGAENFTTIELKSNFMGTMRQGRMSCVATPVHLGRTTQVWDASVENDADGKVIALFRCTQMVLWPR